MADKGGNTGRACAVCVGQRQQCLIGLRRAEQCRALPLHNNRPSCLTPRPLSPAIRVTPRRRPVRHPITPDSPSPNSSTLEPSLHDVSPSSFASPSADGLWMFLLFGGRRDAGRFVFVFGLKKKKLQMELYRNSVVYKFLYLIETQVEHLLLQQNSTLTFQKLRAELLINLYNQKSINEQSFSKYQTMKIISWQTRFHCCCSNFKRVMLASNFIFLHFESTQFHFAPKRMIS